MEGLIHQSHDHYPNLNAGYHVITFYQHHARTHT